VLSLVQETLADLHGLLDDAYKEDLLRVAAEFMSGKVQTSEQRDLQLLQDVLTPDVGCTVVQQHIMKVLGSWDGQPQGSAQRRWHRKPVFASVRTLPRQAHSL
jgi:hypothetical protein